MQKTLTVVSLAAAFSAAALSSAFADRMGDGDIGGGQQAWGAGVDQNPEDYPNCSVWSARERTYVWICGPPYPPNMPHR